MCAWPDVDLTCLRYGPDAVLSLPKVFKCYQMYELYWSFPAIQCLLRLDDMPNP